MLNSSLFAAILGVLLAHLLSTWHEHDAERKRMRSQARRLASLLLNEVTGLRMNLRDKYFFINAHWEELRDSPTGTYEASEVDISTLEHTADQLANVSELSDQPVDLFYTVLRQVKVMLNEYSEAPNEFAAPAVRGMLALRLYNVCMVEKTLAALDHCLRAEQKRLDFLAGPLWRRVWHPVPQPATRVSVPCYLCTTEIDPARFVIGEDHHHNDSQLIDNKGCLTQLDQIACQSAIFRLLPGVSVSASALRGLKQLPVSGSRTES